MHPAISVLLPCYNTAATLDEALQSLAAQTLADFEIIAVDDGSADATPEILAGWAQRDRRLQVFARPHGGIISALNYGLQRCRAGYVARMDADDRCLPLRLALQSKYLDEHPQTTLVSCLVAGFPAAQVQPGFQAYLDWLNALRTDADIRRELYVESPLPHPSVMFRRNWVERAGGYQEHGWAEDYDLWLRLAQAGSRFAKVPETLLEWREHPARLTRQDERYSMENFLRAKAHYLIQGPLQGREAVFIWGAGEMGRRLGRQLQLLDAPLAAYVDIDPRKIGRQRRGLPILAPEELRPSWQASRSPALLAAVGTRGARPEVRRRITALGLSEGEDWWFAA